MKNIIPSGKYNITEMSAWDEDFINPTGQAYIQISRSGSGEFEFGAVQAEIDGKMVTIKDIQRFEFSFQGFDEGDQVSGYGWIMRKDFETIEGEIRFFQGDDSTFLAKKAAK